MTPITIPLPAELQSHIHNMEKENFCLWMFISQNDLWEEAQEFLSYSKKYEPNSWYQENLPF